MSRDDQDDDGRTEGSGNRILVRTWNDGEALMVRQLLATYGIPCQVVSDVPHTVLPLTIDGLGEIRILVPAARLRAARGVLADHLRHGLEVLDGGRPDGDDEDEDVA
ncbi:MAG TPA: DUF2007 domain-containing protein [Candidatus Polarisedimenticolaceae bacterium]|nr:DUF2007 domain-containing protein [Candidatus Polarisedimenticolaceae bacterium]